MVDIKPHDLDGVPHCNSECPAKLVRYRKDGERYARSPYKCAVTGYTSPHGICEPAVRRMHDELVQLRQQQKGLT